MKKILTATFAFMFFFVSCSKEETEKNDIYSSYGHLSLKPKYDNISDYLKVEDLFIPENLSPDFVREETLTYKDTIGEIDSDARIDYRLALRNSFAELEVKVESKLDEVDIRRTWNIYRFKEGYLKASDNTGTVEVEIKPDYYSVDFGRGKRKIKLDNFLFKEHKSKEIISSKNITKRTTMIARGELSDNSFKVYNGDTIYQCTWISENEISMNMLSPEKRKCAVLKKEE